MLTKLLLYKFTNQSQSLSRLLYKVPKQVEVDISQKFFRRILELTKRSPTYIMLKQLFVYLQQSNFLLQQFPYIKSEPKFQQNWMALHLQILKARIVEEKSRSDAINSYQLETFDYNAQYYFYSKYAQYLNPQTPTLYFAKHFIESYRNKFVIFESQFNEHYQSKPDQNSLKILLKKLVYQHRLSQQDQQLNKLCKYYTAHRKYLSLLDWSDMIEYRIKWGFESERKLIESNIE